MRTSKLGFEIETCGRCGGTGKYSYNQMHGSRCYGCGGTGVRHTKRGAAAYKMYADSLKVPLSTIKVGDRIRVEAIAVGVAIAGYFAPVVEVSERSVTTEHPRFGKTILTTAPDFLIRRAWTEEEKAPKLAAALAYQETLSQTGRPRKQRCA